MTPGHDVPTLVGELELSRASSIASVANRDPSHYSQARILVRLHGEPLGFIEVPVPASGLDAHSVAEAAWRSLRSRIDAHLTTDGVEPSDSWQAADLERSTSCRALSPVSQGPPITVVLCTRNRADLLRRTLPSLRELRYPAFEVVLVDNAPEDDQTLSSFRAVTNGDDRFRYVRELQPGLSRARNRGVSEARYAHVAFTDDDATPDPQWIEAIARSFDRSPQVGCVTGLVPAALLDSSAERYFDRRVSWAARLEPRVYGVRGADGLSKFFPFDAGVFGTGANFAVRRDVLISLGGFDEALGAGSPTRGSEDLDLFVRVLHAGQLLAYEPSAIVWHMHRSTDADLRDQMRDYGIALGAFLTKQLREPETRRLFARYFVRGSSHLARSWRRAGRGVSSGQSFARTEIWGLILGPKAYARGARARRQRADRPA